MSKFVKYDENSIQVLQGADKIRKNAGMYVGGANAAGLFTIFKEILDNAVDETRISKGKNIYVDIQADGTITVADCGRGIPVGKHKTTGESTLTTIFTELHAGGKFDARDGATVGTHGVGATATNALSEHFSVYTKRDGSWYSQIFKEGRPTGKVSKIKGRIPFKWKDVSTVVIFRHDPKIFGKLKIDTGRIIEAIKVQSYFLKGVTFHITEHGEKGDAPQIGKYISKNGITDYIADIIKQRELNERGKTFSYSDKDLDIALSWTSLEDELVLSYVSASNTSVGGTHVDELFRVITDSLRAVGGKKAGKIKPALLRSGLLGIVNVRVSRPVFASQTKERLISPEAKAMVAKCEEHLTAYFKKNKTLVKSIIERAIAVGDAEAAFKLSKQAAAKLNGPRGKIVLPKKLAVSTTRDPKKRELFIVEGDSAAGSGQKARDPVYQEVLALRGKFINPYKATAAKVFASDTVLDIFQSIGYNPKEEDPLNKMRVGKIFLLADADEDGKHINALAVTLLTKYMPKLFEMGVLYVVDAPLYKARIGDKNIYGRTLDEINKNAKGTKVRPTRFKGWGEANADELRDIAFNPALRKLIKLHPVSRADRDAIKGIMGEDVQARKELLGLGEQP